MSFFKEELKKIHEGELASKILGKCQRRSLRKKGYLIVSYDTASGSRLKLTDKALKIIRGSIDE